MDASVPETESAAYQRAKSLLREGRPEEALVGFLDVVGSRHDAPESHLEAGLLYLNHLNEPLSAIYHFQQYLAMRPQGEESELVRGLIQTAQKDFLEAMPASSFLPEEQRSGLERRVELLAAENDALKAQLASTRADLEATRRAFQQSQTALQEAQQLIDPDREIAPIVIASAAAEEESATPSTYTVQPGDNLSRISRQVYGTPGRWQEIFQANRDQLARAEDLRPGQVLRIP